MRGFPALTGMRGVAAAWVLFFVLSGFLLARPILARGTDLSRPSFWLGFLRRRWIRIAPPYYASILVALALSGTIGFLWHEPGSTLLHLAYLPTAVPFL